MTALTITYPNTDRSLLTAAELTAAAAGFTITQEDLTALGTYVSATITKACKVVQAGATPPTLRDEGVAESFRLKSHQGYLALARKPIIEINSVVENDTVLDASQYEVDGSLIYKISGRCRICWAYGLIEIDYLAGYADVPDDLKYAAAKFVKAELITGGRDPLLKSKTIEGVSTYEWWVDPTKDSVIPADVMSILEEGGYVRKFGWLS